MQVEYDILTNISFRHEYFSSTRLECLTVRTNKSTEDLMLNRGLLFKPFKDGFALLYETLQNGEQRNKATLLEGALTLRFYVTLTDPNFFNYTDANMQHVAASVYYFHNNKATRPESFSANLLHQEEFISEADEVSYEDFGERSFTKPFALIDLNLNEALQAEYSLHFKEKKTYWRYVLVGDHLKDLQQPAILGEQEVFDGPDKLLLPDKREALSFVSSTPISLKQRPEKQFKLVENYEAGATSHKVIIRSLPVPDITRISSLGNLGEKNKKNMYSEIFIN